MSSIPQDRQEFIINFISKFCGVPQSKVSMKSDIIDDLHIDGDDAIELIEELASLLNANVESFDYSAYFETEGAFNPINGLINLFSSKYERRKLSIEQLIELLEQCPK